MMEVLHGLPCCGLLSILDRHIITFMYVKRMYYYHYYYDYYYYKPNQQTNKPKLLNLLIYLQVNQNGHLTFNAAWNSYTPQRFPMHGPRDFIAPFWTDLDNRGNGHVYYNQYTTGSVLQQATQDINTHFPGLNFNANWVFVATWYEVAYYPNSGTVSQHSVTDLLQKHIS